MFNIYGDLFAEKNFANCQLTIRDHTKLAVKTRIHEHMLIVRRCYTTCMAAGGTAVVVGVPAAIAGIGFTAGGVAAGSTAASMMAASGNVAAGIVLQT